MKPMTAHTGSSVWATVVPMALRVAKTSGPRIEAFWNTSRRESASVAVTVPSTLSASPIRSTSHTRVI